MYYTINLARQSSAVGVPRRQLAAGQHFHRAANPNKLCKPEMNEPGQAAACMRSQLLNEFLNDPGATLAMAQVPQ